MTEPAVTRRTDAAGCCDDPADVVWGRLPGAVPPLRWWLPAVTFGVAALLLSLVVGLLVRPPGPRDNPDPADQRDGLLLAGPQLPAVVAGVTFGGGTVVVLFERRDPAGLAFERWREQVSHHGTRLVVAVAPSPRAQALASATGMPVPKDGGAPVGYAVVDPARRVRYATLDPAYLDNAFEVDVITGAVADAGQ
ncbi:MAG: hypothetical protein LC789_11670 [Actinobacteria bacterium]|nr:hypothetical protein [Actinomycetota bacterium]